MRKFLVLALAAVMMLTVCTAQADRLADIQASGKLRIATEGVWSPWTYHDEAGTLTGYDVEIARLIAAGLGVEPDFDEPEWSAMLAGLGTRYDIVCNGVDYTAERAASYAFSDPYVYTEVVLVVRGDNEDIKSMADLAGKRTSNSPASTYAQRAEAAGATVEYVEALNETLMLVEQGRVDATINAKGSVDEYLEQHPDANLKIVEVMPGDPVCFPVAKGPESDALVAAINQILQELRENGTLAELSIRFFGADLTNPPA